MKKLIISVMLTLITCLIIAIVIGYFYLQNFAQKTIHIKENEQIFVLNYGTSVNHLVKQVELQSLIDNAYLIPYLMKIKPSLRNIKSGTYLLSPNMTVEQFLQLLVSGKEVQFSIQFVEGKRAQDWLLALESMPNISNQLKGLSINEISQKLGLDTPIEGWLYPDTYHYTDNTTDLAILKRAHQNMQTALQKVWDNRDNNLPYKTPYELLIMASIIEKETGIDAERRKVSSVFVNRLKLNMKLQTDPTVIYGMGESYTGQLLRKDTRDTSNVFNTYVIGGLPPTPIAMPSLASLEAAAHPESTPYLYFVADGNGGHTFTTNFNNHQIAVDKYRQIMRDKKSKKVMTNYLRRAEEDDHAKILQLWRVNVTATHQFLTQNDIEYLYQMLKKQWLNNVELWLLCDDNQLLGFIGFDNNKVEMLFVDNNYQGCGHGKRLLNFAKQKYDKIYLDVNEQNPQALAFYQKQGFHIIGRSPFDSLGNPFPLLHLIYENMSVNTQ